MSKIPTLESHAGYKACLDRIAELNERLPAARNEVTALGNGPQATVELDADLDDAVVKHQKATDAHGKLRLRHELKVSMLERALQIEEAKIPELRQQAEDYVGRAASELHQKYVERLLELKREMSDALTLASMIRYRVRLEINKQTAGYKQFQLEEKYCWTPAIGTPASAADHVIPTLVQEALAPSKTDV